MKTGSGKGLTVQALTGTLPPKLTARGHVTIAGQVNDPAKPDRFRRLWGRPIRGLPQEAWLSLDPLMRARDRIAETHALVGACHTMTRGGGPRRTLPPWGWKEWRGPDRGNSRAA